MLLGPPASGKGTIADRLQITFGLAIVSPGNLLRAEKATGTELGIKAHELTQRGGLVGDDIINGLVHNWLSQQSGTGFVFDGYPRTIGQAHALDEMLTARGRPLEQVLLLEADVAVLRQRVENRAICAACGNIVSLGLQVASLEDGCSRCGGHLTRRSDDNPETLEHRLVEYHAKTEPLIRHYEEKHLLARISTEASPADVFEAVSKLLA